MAAEIDARADQLARRLAPDPRPARARLRGALRPRPARPGSSRTPGWRSTAGRLRRRHGVRGAGRHAGPTSPCCASTTPCPASATPAATTSSPPPASAPGSRPRRWPTSWAAGCVVLGTPAEEGGGGKVRLIERGAFDGRRRGDDGAPRRRRPVRAWTPSPSSRSTSIYHGRAAHAAACPHRGRNALDAAVLGYVNVAALRQHIRPDERIHGIFTEGGDRPNIVPGARRGRTGTSGRPRSPALEPLKARVLACLEAGAAAAGCTMDVEWHDPAYADMRRQRADRRAATAANAEPLGRRSVDPRDGARVVGSTDMGNVSHVVPSIHPMIAVAPPSVADPHPGVRRLRRRARGRRGGDRRGQGDGLTVVDLWADAGPLDAGRAARRRRPASGRAHRSAAIAGGPAT